MSVPDAYESSLSGPKMLYYSSSPLPVTIPRIEAAFTEDMFSGDYEDEAYDTDKDIKSRLPKSERNNYRLPSAASEGYSTKPITATPAAASEGAKYRYYYEPPPAEPEGHSTEPITATPAETAKPTETLDPSMFSADYEEHSGSGRIHKERSYARRIHASRVHELAMRRKLTSAMEKFKFF
jgi:hypothetical protein